VSQDLYAGSSEQQVDALTDLLMHFDTFAKRTMSLEAFLRQQAPPPPPPQQGQPAAPPRAAAAPASPSPGREPLSALGSSEPSAGLN